MSIEGISGIICEEPDVFGRVPIARPVPKLIRSPSSNSWLVNMFMCLVVFFNTLKTTKRLTRGSTKEKASTTIENFKMKLQEHEAALSRSVAKRQ